MNVGLDKQCLSLCCSAYPPPPPLLSFLLPSTFPLSLSPSPLLRCSAWVLLSIHPSPSPSLLPRLHLRQTSAVSGHGWCVACASWGGPQHLSFKYLAAIRRLIDRDFPFEFDEFVKRKASSQSICSSSPFLLLSCIHLQNFNVEVTPSERAMLAYFLAKLHRIDPDIIVVSQARSSPSSSSYPPPSLIPPLSTGSQSQLLPVGSAPAPHACVSGASVVSHRSAETKRHAEGQLHPLPLLLYWFCCLDWSLFSPSFPSPSLLTPSLPTPSQGHAAASFLCVGRPVCDVRISAEELVRVRSYDLTELSASLLHTRHVALEHEEIVRAFR